MDRFTAPRPGDSSPVALVALLAGNLVPLVGVLAWEWNLFFVLVTYWLESGIVGLLTVPRILTAAGGDSGSYTLTINGRPVSFGAAADPGDGLRIRSETLPLAGFFCLHYGIFWVVHGVFVLTLFGSAASPTLATVQAVAVAGGALFVSHLGSFVTNFIQGGEYRTVGPSDMMMRPYRRVVVLHLTIIFGGMAIAAIGSPIGALVLLVLLKTGFDVVTHLREHRRDRRSAGVTDTVPET